MARHNNLGQEGETAARRHLEQLEYEILETNWRAGHLEADIIAYHDHKIVFIEVKTRTSTDYGDPDQFVDQKKRLAYIRLANAYILQHDRNEEARFDIISVVIDDHGTHIDHLVDAYTTVG